MATDNQTRKETYATPSVEVIRMENEGLIAVSGEGSSEDYTSIPMNRTHVNGSYSSASSNDLEDLINDILTVEN